MQIVKQYPDGVFSWVDLGTTDIAGAKAFYSGLFGWLWKDEPTDSGVIYSMAQIEGYNVAGLGPLDLESQKIGVPPHWSSYVKHDNLDAVTARASDAGGIVLLPPMDVMEAGRMTLIQDPAGAVFGLWQPGQHIGAELVNMPNTLTWNELQAPDLAIVREFYTELLGWTYEVDNAYVSVKAGDRVQAGMMSLPADMGQVPPNWSVYFLVDDVAASAGRAGKLGANVIVPPMPAGEIGKFAVIQDPQGAFFSIIQYAGPASPPPGY